MNYCNCTVYQAPGWHGEPDDPIILDHVDEYTAALRAGRRADLEMPGASNKYDAYAEDGEGNRIEPIESYECGVCGQIFEWGYDGPSGGMMDDRIMEFPASVPKHLVTWCCEDCADAIEAQQEQEEEEEQEQGDTQ